VFTSYLQTPDDPARLPTVQREKRATVAEARHEQTPYGLQRAVLSSRVTRLDPLQSTLKDIPLRQATTWLVIAFSLAACTNVDSDGRHSLHTDPASASRSLEPGDQDYPVLNPTPSQEVQFTAVLPQSFASEFRLRYLVETVQDANDPKVFHSPPGCRWTQNASFYIDMPLTLERKGDRLTGTFSPDAFRPGACGWHFDVIRATIANVPLAVFNHSNWTSPHPMPDLDLDLTSDERHFWCAHRNEGRAWQIAPNQAINCVPFDMIGFWSKLPAGFVKSIRREDIQPGSHVITQYLKRITVEFHDVDAAASDYLKQNRSANTSAVHGATKPK
jgi:hypothetical protein